MGKRYWLIHWTNFGFDYPVIIHGTEDEMREYCRYQYGYVPRYSGATDKEIEAAKTLHMKMYLAPEL